jgi:hypothetical protein
LPLFEFFPFISFKSQESGLAKLFINITSDRYYYENTIRNTYKHQHKID